MGDLEPSRAEGASPAPSTSIVWGGGDLLCDLLRDFAGDLDELGGEPLRERERDLAGDLEPLCGEPLRERELLASDLAREPLRDRDRDTDLAGDFELAGEPLRDRDLAGEPLRERERERERAGDPLPDRERDLAGEPLRERLRLPERDLAGDEPREAELDLECDRDLELRFDPSWDIFESDSACQQTTVFNQIKPMPTEHRVG